MLKFSIYLSYIGTVDIRDIGQSFAVYDVPVGLNRIVPTKDQNIQMSNTDFDIEFKNSLKLGGVILYAKMCNLKSFKTNWLDRDIRFKSDHASLATLVPPVPNT